MYSFKFIISAVQNSFKIASEHKKSFEIKTLAQQLCRIRFSFTILQQCKLSISEEARKKSIQQTMPQRMSTKQMWEK